MRWSQLAVFSSHMLYHGTSPREACESPAIANLAKQWWNLRYALIPYLVEQDGRSTSIAASHVIETLHVRTSRCDQISETDLRFYSGSY